MIEKLLAAAQTHGQDSAPDHEVGDLQQLLRAAWGLMTEAQRNTLVEDNSAVDVLVWEGATPTNYKEE